MLRIDPGHVRPLVICVLLALLHTWPLATAPAILSLNANGDAMLNEWILAWVAHQVPRHPITLFDANIFHPANYALAFSEPLIVPALMGAPMAWLGASPVLVYTVLLIAGFALTAAAGYALVFWWTRDRAAALVTGSALAFNTHTLARLAHVQAIHVYGLPLALLSTDRLIAQPRARHALLLATWMTVMAYTSGYLIVFATLAVAIMLVVRFGEWRHHARALILHLGAAAAGAGVAVLPIYLAYRAAAREHGLRRTLENVSDFAATPSGYLATIGTVHARWSAALTTDPGVNAFFAGFAVIALAVVAVVFAAGGNRDTHRFHAMQTETARIPVFAMVVLGAIGAVLSFGTATPIYGWLYTVFPPMQGLRVASRFGNLYLLSMAVLAGAGLAILRQRVQTRSMRLAVAIGAVALVNIEAAVAPIAYQKFNGIPRIYSAVAAAPDPVVLVEVPAYPPEAIHENAAYVLASTAHWKKLVNGYSGYTPSVYREIQPMLWYFPQPRALEAMQDAGVTHVIVHRDRLGAEADAVVRDADASPQLELLAIGDAGVRLYKLRR